MNTAGVVALTVLTGLLIFVLGQLALGLFVERINIQARAIEEIAQKLVIHASIYSSPYGCSLDAETRLKLEEIRLDFRRLAALLSSTVQTLTWYPLFEELHLVKSREQVQSAASAILGLSNSIGSGESGVKEALDYRLSICQYLGLLHD